jgi:hypothetical protein
LPEPFDVALAGRDVAIAHLRSLAR